MISSASSSLGAWARGTRSGLPRCHALAAMAALLLAAPSYAGTMAPKQIEYKVGVNEDPAAKVCQLAVALGDAPTGERVNFQLIVAQMKRQGILAGPLVTAYTVDRRTREITPARSTPPARLVSAAFVSARYTSVALPKDLPFEDGSVAASTLDFAQGQELIMAVLRAEFELRFTLENSASAPSYKISAPPPADVLSEFSGCLGSLAPSE
jgi:hypothetical protein